MIAFAEFLAAARAGRVPYPWQQRFAEEAAAGRTPQVVAVPTGTGKTTVADALVWALASQAGRPPLERTVGVRVVWTIDRRLLVDEVHDEARRLAERLAAALHSGDPDDPLHGVATRLQALKGDDATGPPLLATRWRGGVPITPPARHPLQAEIITSTLAQIGSRLLFRGYGLGDGSLPVGAALAACDTTICLDEAHLAEPFAQTVASIGRRLHRDKAPIAAGSRLIRLTATPARGDAHDTLTLTAADRSVLRARLEAPKWAQLVTPATASDADVDREVRDAAVRHLAEGARSVAVVVNTVRAARTLFNQLRKDHPQVDCALLMGPQRAADRADALDRAVDPAAPDGPTRRSVLFDQARATRPLVIVATQAFEVGLDADVDALVTQSASATALTQRLGRLNRAGHREGRATIVRHEGFGLYADDEPAAWAWLEGLPQRERAADVSVASLVAHPAPAPVRTDRAAELTDVVVELLAQTSPRPHVFADPDIEVLIRGVDADPQSDVALCWRTDLRLDDDGEAADAYRSNLLSLVPPQAEEQLLLSVSAARNLLRVMADRTRTSGPGARRQVHDVPDVEGYGPEELAGDPMLAAAGLVVRGPETERLGGDTGVRLSAIRPGDVLVLPLEAGGVDAHGLDATSPRANDVAADLADPPDDEVRVPPIRLTPEALDAALDGRVPDHRRAEAVRSVLRNAARLERAATPQARAKAIESLAASLIDHPCGAHVGIDADLRRVTERAAWDVAELEDESELPDDEEELAGPMTLPGEDEQRPPDGWVLLPPRTRAPDDVRRRDARPPTLQDHAEAVMRRASGFCASAGLPGRLRATVVLAARAHDHGKADPRMQAFFRGGAPAAIGEPLLAKSVFGTADRSADRAARTASGLPGGLRHELASAALLRCALDRGDLDEDKVDVDLAIHLVTTHHGRGRPVPPVPHGGLRGRPFHVDVAGVAGSAKGDGLEGWDEGASLRRFTRLSEVYGHWGLAYLEALLVLADRTVSAEGG